MINKYNTNAICCIWWNITYNLEMFWFNVPSELTTTSESCYCIDIFNDWFKIWQSKVVENIFVALSCGIGVVQTNKIILVIQRHGCKRYGPRFNYICCQAVSVVYIIFAYSFLITLV